MIWDSTMNIKILYDLTTAKPQLHTGWGFSCLIDDQILFDTGKDGGALLHNLRLMEIELSGVKSIIISHEHCDHDGGLWEILKNKPELLVHICPNFSSAFKTKIKSYKGIYLESQSWREIGKDILTTGEMKGFYKTTTVPEQSVVLRTKQGLVVITGCAHSSIIEIIKEVKKHFPQDDIYLVLGGFHLVDATESEIDALVKNVQRLQVEKIAPLHCSGDKAKELFKSYYGDNFIELQVGEALEC